MNYSKNSHIPITQRPQSSWANSPNNVLSSLKKNAFQDCTLYSKTEERGQPSIWGSIQTLP